MLLVLWALQTAPPDLPSYPRLHLTPPAEWVDRGHITPFAPAILAAARRAEVTAPPPEPPAVRARDIRLWRPDGVDFALLGVSRLLAGSGARRPHEAVPPVAR